ncbi:MAG: hypothetical protein QOI66_4168 [Myxococcales bacterium]|nr:hypothetical protein [Myxococcales bacterium]
MGPSSRRFLSWLALGAVALALSVGAGCDSRRSRRSRAPNRPVVTVPPAEPPPVEEPVAVAPPRPPVPPPAPPRAPAPAPARPRPKDDRLGACGTGKGPRFNVRGVDEQDTLNVRAAPDTQSDVLGQLSPHATGVLSLGQRRHVGASTWHKVKCGGVVGWVNERFLSTTAEP